MNDIFQGQYDRMKKSMTTYCLLVWFAFVGYKLFAVGFHLLATWKFWLFLLIGMFGVCPLVAMVAYGLTRLLSKISVKAHLNDNVLILLGYLFPLVEILVIWILARQIFVWFFGK